ncbi:hypothetical protein BEN35_02095 [Streptomyces fradiae]|nr:hypothetical protein BEN35_02095 [Streptomyces fradiae]
MHHLDVRIDAVVLHAPAVTLHPGGVLGLGDARAVHQVVTAVDADDAAPGAGADDRADAQRLDRGVDDVAVGAGELVRDRDDGPARRVLRIAERPHAAREVPADDAAGQLLHDELRGVPAAVLPDVHDQPVPRHLHPQVAVELRPAGAHHVRHVEIAEPAAGRLVHMGAPPGDPVVVAQRLLVGDGDDDGVPGGAAAGRGDRQFDGLAGRADEQRAGAQQRIDGAAVHGQDRVSGTHRDTGRGERGAGLGVGGLGGQHARHAPHPFLIPGQIGPEQALPVGGVGPAAGRADIGVRGAQLALDLPEQVDQVAVRGHPVQHRPVALQDAVPVDASEVGPPEVVPHQPAGLRVHLPPLGGRVDREADPGEVDGDVVVAVVVARLVVGRHHAELRAGGEQDPLAVAGDRVVVGVIGQMLEPLLDEVVAVQGGGRPGGVRGQGGAEHAAQRVAQPQDAALGGPQGGVAGGLDGERHDAVGESVQIDPGDGHRGGAGRGGRAALALVAVVALGRGRAAVALRAERRGRGGGERDQMRPAGAHERQVEDMDVIDRVEGAFGEEGQMPAVGGEGGREVAEAQRGGLGHGEIGRVGDLELAERPRPGVRPGQPAGVRGEDQAVGVTVLAPVHLADLTGLALHEQHPPVVRGDGDPAAVRGDGEVQHPAEPPGADTARSAAGLGSGGRGDGQGVLALRVGDPDDVLGAVHAERARQPRPLPGFGGERPGGALPVGDPVDRAAHLHGAAAAGVVGAHLAEVVRGTHRVRLEVGAGPAEADVEAARLGAVRLVQAVQEPEFTGRGVGDAGAVAGGLPGVEAVEGGMAAQVAAVGQRGVQCAGALVVGEERDPAAGPQRLLDVAVETGVNPFELTAAGGVQPEFPGRAAPVALPGRGVAPHGRGEQQHGALGPVRHIADRPVRQGARGAAVQRHGPRPGAAQGCLARGGDRQHLPLGGPAAHGGPGVAPVRQPPGRAAVDGGHMDLR